MKSIIHKEQSYMTTVLKEPYISLNAVHKYYYQEEIYMYLYYEVIMK